MREHFKLFENLQVDFSLEASFQLLSRLVIVQHRIRDNVAVSDQVAVRAKGKPAAHINEVRVRQVDLLALQGTPQP